MASRQISTQSCIVFLSLLNLTIASGTLYTDQESLQRRAYNDINCTTDRSSDYYGLGVRLGFYFQWLTSWVANVSVPDEVAGALDTNSIFLFALLLSMVKCTVTQLLMQLDGLLLMHLSGGTIFSILSIWGYRTVQYHVDGPSGIRHFGGFGSHLRLLLSTAISAFGLWYWLYGLMGGLPTLGGECEEVYTFMFAKVRATGGIRIFYIFICISCLVYFGTMLLVSSIAGFARLTKIANLTTSGWWKATSRLKFATGLNVKELRFIFHALRILNLLWIIFSMIMIEYTLNYNHVQSVLGWRGHIFFPAQMIPMLIGMFGFLRILFIRFSQYRSPDDIEPSLGRDPTMPQRASTAPRGFGWLKVFTAATRAGDPSAGHEDSDIDPCMEGRPRWQRYLVAWLPWLALTKWIRADKMALPSFHKNNSGNELHRPNENTEKEGQRQKRETWEGDSTVRSDKRKEGKKT